ncbi:restriction endonuclease [Bacillus cereus]|nr:restriction endonuclease [Bacillus cereus]PEW53071.1 restriction endonuclease [Bacillus cereus]PEX41748.1 restriction endonuclease [Bacillus cereus]PEZ94831.1 restriction endonuclease [Bacillus cereus]PFF03806.1 restriction endonuclease [Bacillus cereus]
MNADQLYNQLLSLNLSSLPGNIIFNLAGVSVTIDTTDTVGITLQAWLKQYLIDNNIYFSEPTNTQEFPDFFLDNVNPTQNMLEIKAFNYRATPAFDIANFESYCSSVKFRPDRLNADYLIFGYLMSTDGSIYIHKIWLKKIWEIAGKSARFPLKTQVKRDMIYNIRPNSQFKFDNTGPFTCKEDFLQAIYHTLAEYKGIHFAHEWLSELSQNYQNHYGQPLTF